MLWAAVLLALWPAPSPAEASFKAVRQLMGSRFEITALAADRQLAAAAVEAAYGEIARIERLISSWDPDSQTSRINRAAGRQPVAVDPELFRLVRRSLKVSRLTGGAFDISYAALDRLWRFDGSMAALPDSASVAASVAGVDYRKIHLHADSSAVFLKGRGMRIGFGAIGKGYAANRARDLMRRMGIERGLVNAGGDLVAWGAGPDGGRWRVGIADPKAEGRAIAWLLVGDGAVVTSGDYQKFAVIDGRRYAHIIDPRTGWPASGVKSATVLCADAELADALATAVFVLGEEEGLRLIDRLQGVDALIVNDRDQLRASRQVELDYRGGSQDPVHWIGGGDD